MRKSKRKDDQIRVRVAHDEKRLLAEVARQRGLTLSAFMRQTVHMAAWSMP